MISLSSEVMTDVGSMAGRSGGTGFSLMLTRRTKLSQTKSKETTELTNFRKLSNNYE